MVVSTHSRPKAAAGRATNSRARSSVSTHSRPKVAACLLPPRRPALPGFQLTAAQRRLRICVFPVVDKIKFQLTAAQRRLRRGYTGHSIRQVSTHSRPKAAAWRINTTVAGLSCFNSQPPKGGCAVTVAHGLGGASFNSQPPKGGCPSLTYNCDGMRQFQLTAAQRRLPFRWRPNGAKRSFNSQPPKGGCQSVTIYRQIMFVSTHSRPKAAARTTR